MNLPEILKAQNLRPFRPFRLALTTGESIEIDRPEDLYVNTKRKLVVTFDDEGVAVFEPQTIGSLKSLRPAPR